MITPEAVLSWPELFVPSAQNDGEKPKYKATLIFLEETDLSAMKKAALEALMAEFNMTRTQVSEAVAKNRMAWPFNTDPEKLEKKGYPAGSTVVNVKTYKKPGIVSIFPDPNTGKPMPIVNEDEVEFGAIVRVSVNPYAYDTKGNKGVSFWMNNLQVVGRSDILGGGGVKAEDEFEADASAVADLSDMEEPVVDEPVAAAKGGGTDLDDLLL